MPKKYRLNYPQVGEPYPAQNTDAEFAKYENWWAIFKSWVVNLAPDQVVTRTQMADKMAQIEMQVK